MILSCQQLIISNYTLTTATNSTKNFFTQRHFELRSKSMRGLEILPAQTMVFASLYLTLSFPNRYFFISILLLRAYFFVIGKFNNFSFGFQGFWV